LNPRRLCSPILPILSYGARSGLCLVYPSGPRSRPGPGRCAGPVLHQVL
jgi:hypothetical protein